MNKYLSNIKRLSSKILEEIIFDVYILSDNTKKIIYISSISAGISPYYVERICNKEELKIDKIKRLYAWEIRKFIEGIDEVVIDMHKSLIKFFSDGILIPYRVKQVLKIDLDSIKFDKDIKKMSKYSYEILTGSEALKFYYDKMLIPHIKKRYGDSARIDDYSSLEKILENGELLFIKLNGDYVSGELCEKIDDTYFLRSKGVIDESFVKDGALVAATYFSILRAKDRKLKIVDFGASKPFLLDGVLRHKNLWWGPKICKDETAKRFIYLKNASFTEPYIYIDKDNDKLKVDIFPKDMKLIKEYDKSGLEFNIIKNIK